MSLFNFSLPKNNILGLPLQTTQAVADGNWIFLKPVNVGQYNIKFNEVNKTIVTPGSNLLVQLNGTIKLHIFLPSDDKKYFQ